MHYRTFGKTGWRVSEIGIGTMPIAGTYGHVEDEQGIRTLLHAFDRGINYVDTAMAYGEGRAHKIIGQALRQWKGGRIYVATKTWPMRWPSPWDDDPPMRGRYPSWYLEYEVEKTLKQLQIERIDLLQLHCWMPRGTVELDWLETLNRLRLQGKVDRIGVSLRDNRPEEGIDLARLGLVDSIQVVFNLFDQRPADRLFREGEKTGTAFVARVPFDSGSLVGSWTPEINKTWSDLRSFYFGGWRFEETFKRVEALKRVCRPHYPTLAEAAMRYCLSDPAVSVVIPGMATPEEVDLNVAYSDGTLFPPELREALLPHRWARNFYVPDEPQDLEIKVKAHED